MSPESIRLITLLFILFVTLVATIHPNTEPNIYISHFRENALKNTIFFVLESHKLNMPQKYVPDLRSVRHRQHGVDELEFIRQ